MSSPSRTEALVRNLALKYGGKQAVRVIRKMKARGTTWVRRVRHVDDYGVVSASALFDERWYRATYPDVPLNTDAVTHFLMHGAQSGYNPGPLFDVAWYLSAHPDVAASGMNPLIHYIRWGEREGRAKRSVGAAVGKGDMLPLRSDQNVRVHGTIAVVIHAFYADVFEALCPLLSNIPGRFDLYVSTPSDEVSALVKRSLEAHSINSSAVIRVSQNRGRNFGPFLVEFSRDVLRHDFVLHMHTKKSLYTGLEQTSWRDHLYDSLIGDPDLVRAILGQFAEHPDLGVVYPVIASTMPYWAHHWLSNSHLAPGLFQRINIADYQAEGMIDYPVGGMFWGRVEALRPLFVERFQYTDFPEEAGQTDGTLAHAIERAIVQVVKARGYGFGEVDTSANAMRYNWSERNLHQYASLTSDTLRARIQEADLVSFDIFDTLLLRPSVAPNSVLRYVGALVMRKFPSARDFFEMRRRAELEARKRTNFEGDVDLDAIYAEFPVTAYWPPEAVRFAQDTEIALETRIAKPRADGVEAVQYARSIGKRVIAISDTYMSRPLVEQLLGSVGLKQSFNDIYVSADRQARKDRGDLWQLVMEREKVPPHRWLHVGDNEHSDVQRPSDLGITTHHFMNPTTLTRLRGFEGMLPYGNSNWGTDLILGPLVNRVASSPFLAEGTFRPLSLSTPFDVGYVVFGPIAFTFTAWLANRLRAHDRNHVYFLAREGYALRRFYETIKRHTTDHALPESTYLLTSRRTVLSALQGLEFDPQEVTGVAYYNGTLAGLLQSRLGLTVPPGSNAGEITIRLPEDTSWVIPQLQALKAEIVAHGEKEYGLYNEYCEAVGLLDTTTSAAVVDIGYSGTIQRVLQKLTRQPLTGYYLGTFEGAREVERMGGRAYGCFTEGLAPFASPAPVVQHSLLLEAFLCAPHGQVSGFKKDAEDLQPLYKPDTRTAEELEALAEMQAGANIYCEDLLRAYGSAILDVESNLQAVQEPLKLLGEREIKVPAQVGHALAVEDEFTGSGTLVVGKRLITI